MTDLRQAAQQALEALDSDNPDIQLRAAVTLRTALEQQAEPVAHYDFQECKFTWAKPMKIGPVPVSVAVDPMKLYSEAPQRQWQCLTDEDVRQCSRDVVAGGTENAVDRFAYAIEAKLKERNT